VDISFKYDETLFFLSLIPSFYLSLSLYSQELFQMVEIIPTVSEREGEKEKLGEAILLGEMAPLGGHCRVNGGTFVFMSAREREREDDDAGVGVGGGVEVQGSIA
jgi:hypothetical protein